MNDIEKIIHDFGKVQEDVAKRMLTHYPSFKFPISLLPYKKEEIFLAFEKAIEINKDNPETVDLLKSGLVFLDGFVDDEAAYNSNHKLLGQSGYWDALRKNRLIS